MKIGIIQIEPIFLNAKETWKKLKEYIIEVANSGAKLITWGETLIPGYPSWVSISHGAKFNDRFQKEIYSVYYNQSLIPKIDPIMKEMKLLAKQLKVMMIGGITEQENGSIYCTLVTIGKEGELLGRHRKLKPTYEERLVWADGDPKNITLRSYKTNAGKVGSLNCWENWIPYARAALHRQGELIHISIWPGSIGLTKDISKFIALEGRSYSIAASGILRAETLHHFLQKVGFNDDSLFTEKEFYQNGGSVAYDPSGKQIIDYLVGKEGTLLVDVHKKNVIEERQNFDYSGNYSRFDIFNEPLKKK